MLYKSKNKTLSIYYYYMGPGKSTALLSTFHNGLSALSAPMLLLALPPQCYISVLPAGGKRKGN